PPRPEALIEGFLVLKEKVRRERLLGYKVESMTAADVEPGEMGEFTRREREEALAAGESAPEQAEGMEAR
ncbi:MAG: hypothetical protein QGH59_08980, partial [Gemmatimonadota bacterium]|nr:hypothetical protein [Gemmatimonadota bacterium]